MKKTETKKSRATVPLRGQFHEIISLVPIDTPSIDIKFRHVILDLRIEKKEMNS
jgi:hypothetical protein